MDAGLAPGGESKVADENEQASNAHYQRKCAIRPLNRRNEGPEQLRIATLLAVGDAFCAQLRVAARWQPGTIRTLLASDSMPGARRVDQLLDAKPYNVCHICGHRITGGGVQCSVGCPAHSVLGERLGGDR